MFIRCPGYDGGRGNSYLFRDVWNALQPRLILNSGVCKVPDEVWGRIHTVTVTEFDVEGALM